MKRPRILLIVLIMPVLSLAQKKNYKDDAGKKQGIYYDYSGGWLFERTYRNDTLNGFFRKYTKDGTTWRQVILKPDSRIVCGLSFTKTEQLKKGKTTGMEKKTVNLFIIIGMAT